MSLDSTSATVRSREGSDTSVGYKLLKDVKSSLLCEGSCWAVDDNGFVISLENLDKILQKYFSSKFSFLFLMATGEDLSKCCIHRVQGFNESLEFHCLHNYVGLSLQGTSR